MLAKDVTQKQIDRGVVFIPTNHAGHQQVKSMQRHDKDYRKTLKA